MVTPAPKAPGGALLHQEVSEREMKIFMIALCVCGVTAAVAGPRPHALVAVGIASGLLRTPYIAASGQTVPHPGTAQSVGNTGFDLRIEGLDDQIMNSVCNGCR